MARNCSLPLHSSAYLGLFFLGKLVTMENLGSNKNPNFEHLIFSGGTGRSGTTIIGRLLSRHSKIAMAKPAEIKFLTSGNGLLDLHLGRKVGRYKSLLITERLHLERFKYRLFHDWWSRDDKSGGITGLQSGIPREVLEEIFSLMKSQFDTDKTYSIQLFMSSFVDHQLKSFGKKLWIDTTPINLSRAVEIENLLPNSKFIHMIRDGRDVIASVIRERWGPNTYDEGLIWYRKRMIKSLTSTKILDSKVLTLSLEDLVINNRKPSIEKLLSFLELKPEPKFNNFFDEIIRESSISRRRWKNEVPDLANFNNAYADLLEEFKEINPELPLTI